LIHCKPPLDIFNAVASSTGRAGARRIRRINAITADAASIKAKPLSTSKIGRNGENTIEAMVIPF
jgi:hypothetical protein